MPELDDALTTLAAWLEREHVPYMVIGGFAVTVWGEHAATKECLAADYADYADWEQELV